jgi:arylsulfatase
VARYERTYTVGWDSIRAARYRRLAAEGIVDSAHARLSPRVQPERDWRTNATARWDARAMAVHAAMVERMDEGVGRIVAALERSGRLRNTVILFLSDNGASPEDPSRFGPGFDRAGGTRDGRAVHFPVAKDSLPGPQTVHAGIGPVWANVANTPFRGAKARTLEGGIATPLIAYWPAGIGARAGAVTRQPGHVVDLMATALDLAGAPPPTTRAGGPVVPLAGRSLAPALRTGATLAPTSIYWEHEGAQALREGDWKLVAPARGAAWELYDLARDRTELTDLAGRDPARVRAMSERWTAWATRTAVLPRPAARP